MEAKNKGAFVKGEKRPNQGKRGPDKNTKELKDMILQALSNKGGVEYLERQADENPNAFMSLIGKVLPMTIQGTGKNGEITVTKIELVPLARHEHCQD